MKRVSAQFDVAGVPIKHLSAERKRQLGARTLKPIEAERMIEMISPVIVEIIRAMDEKQYRRWGK